MSSWFDFFHRFFDEFFYVSGCECSFCLYLSFHIWSSVFVILMVFGIFLKYWHVSDKVFEFLMDYACDYVNIVDRVAGYFTG